MITPHNEQAVTLVKVVQTINELYPDVLKLLDEAYAVFMTCADSFESNFHLINFDTEDKVSRSMHRIGCHEVHLAVVHWIRAMRYPASPQLLEIGFELLSARHYCERADKTYAVSKPFLMVQDDFLKRIPKIPVFAEQNVPPVFRPFDATSETREQYVCDCEEAISSYANSELVRLTMCAYKAPEMWKRENLERQTLIDLARMRMASISPAQLLSDPEKILDKDTKTEISRKMSAASREKKDVVRTIKRMMRVLDDDSYWPDHGLRDWKLPTPEERVTVECPPKIGRI